MATRLSISVTMFSDMFVFLVGVGWLILYTFSRGLFKSPARRS